MKRILIQLSFIVSAFLMISCMSCSKDSGEGNGGELIVEPKPEMNLLDLFYSLVDEQSETGTRSKVFVVAHRANTFEGVRNNVPDNSIPAIDLAVKHGADMVELDVRTTADGVFVMAHDATIDHFTNGTGNVADMTYEEICQYDMQKNGVVYRDAEGNTIKVPTLAQALAACKDRIYVNIDTKDINARLLVDAIKEAGMQDQVMIYTGDRSFAESCQKVDINVAVHPYVYSADDMDYYRNTGMTGAVLFQYGNTCIYGDNPSNPEMGRQIRAKGGLSYTNLLEMYDAAMLNGDYSYVRQFVESESDFVQTDYCEKVIEYLELVDLR